MSKTVVFFGSGPVAAKSLQLLAENFPVEAVITKPKPSHHRGAVPVIETATELGIPIYTATDKKTLDELFTTLKLQSPLAILIDFGIIVSQKVIDYFPLGIINSHFSLLPEWRGADPITFSILSGQKQTGVSLMLLTAGMDEGPLLAQAPFDVPEDITTPDLTETLIELSNSSLTQIIPLWLEGSVTAMPQESVTISAVKTPTYSRKLAKDDSILDWTKPAEVLEREIRAFLEWPRSRTAFNGLDVVITKAHVDNTLSGTPGMRDIVNKRPVIYCDVGALVIDTLKPAGKKEMTGEAFLAGYKSYFLE